MPSPDLQWLTFNDFSPGIQQRLHKVAGAGIGKAPGIAQLDNTFRCIALPSGGLGPLPKLTESFISADLSAEEPDDGFYHVVGLLAFGPITAGGFHSDEVHFGFEFIEAGVRKFRWQRFNLFDGSNTFETLKAIDSAQVAPPISQYTVLSMGSQRMNPTDPTLPGYPVVGASWAVVGEGDEKFVSLFPDPNFPNVTGVQDLALDRSGEVVMHQNRLVLLEHIAYNHGGIGGMPENEQISFTDANDNNLGDQKQVFVSEHPNGYGAWGSISAGELFLVKHQGGGVMVSEDIADPTVTRLSGVVPTGLNTCKGASCPSGFMYYANDAGAYLWRGADTVVKASTQLEDDFLLDLDIAGYFGARVNFESWNEWVLASNNYLFDTVSESWWRFEDPDVAKIWAWSRSSNGSYMYGAPAKWASGEGVLHVWRKIVPALSYSWQGHPIFVNNERQINVREIVLVAEGEGTVDLSFTDEHGALVVTSFELEPGLNVIRKNAKVQAFNVLMRIEAEGPTAAPLIHEVRVGWAERMKLPVTPDAPPP